MEISTSILSIKDNFIDNINKLNSTDTDYIHLDIMDGKFVNNTSFTFETIEEVYKNTKKKLDIHLMVENPLEYIEKYKSFNPEYLTIHYETNNYLDCINKIKENNIKVGLSIKPNTNVEEIYNLLNKLDLVLIMSVDPGFGGQKFIDNTINKIRKLRKYIDNNNLNVLIEVDGGINSDNSKSIIDSGANILVSGSFITNQDNYQMQIDKLRN